MSSEINHNPTLKAALNIVQEHATQTAKVVATNLSERKLHDPLTKSIQDGFAALDQARINKAKQVSAEGLGHSNPIVSEKNIA